MPNQTAPTRLACYTLAVAATAAAVLLRYILTPLLGDGAPFTIFLLAVVATAGYGGLGPGLLATALGFVLGDLLFVHKIGSFSFDPANTIRFVSYAMVGISISVVSGWWHRARRRNELRTEELQAQAQDRLRLVEELAHAKQTLEALVATAPIPIVVIDPDRTIKLWNKEAERVFGWRAEDVLWKTTPIVPINLIEESRAVWSAVERGETVGPIPTIRQRKDGALVHIELSAAPLYGPRGQVENVVLLLNDVNERARVQSALARSEERLREANRQKDEFLATLAHELRNPLAPIRNSLQVMRLSSHDVFAVEKTCAVIERQVAQLVRLTDDLLDVSRITVGKMDLRKERIDLGSVLQRAIESSRPLIDARHHRLTPRFPPQPILLEADLTRLAQVVSNLLQNAAKYTAPGGTIELSARQEEDRAVIEVRDNGIGIAPEMLPRVFELFMQVDRSEERSHGGTGIGLTLVKRIIEMHNGSVEARSGGIGTGSRFIVSLPALPASLPLPSTENGAEPTATPVRRRILVVDDSEDSATSLAMLLDLMGHETMRAYDGYEATRLAEEFRPEVMLLDLGMPGMSGYEVCRKVRERPEGATMTVIALTGWGQEEDRQRTQAAGFDHHLVKPVEPMTLAVILDRLDPKRHPDAITHR